MLNHEQKFSVSNKIDPIKDQVWNLMLDISAMQQENPWDQKQIDENIPGPIMDLHFIYRKLNDFQMKVNEK